MINPKRNIQQLRGNIGSSAFELFVNRDLNWVFRPVHQEHDFGIDGYIDIVEENQVTGVSIAVQIKCGESYVAKKTIGGFRYDGNIKHLNYYANIREPVLLIILDPQGNEGWWTEFELSRTNPGASEDKWWIEIPETSQLVPGVKNEWKKIAGPAKDFTQTIQEQWERDRLYTFSTNLVVGIEKKYVISNDPRSIFLWQENMMKTKQMMLAKRAKVDFWFPGWDEDDRELFQIPEIRKYIKNTLESGFPWFYWLQPDCPWQGYQLLLTCTCSIAKERIADRKMRIETTGVEIGKWLDLNFLNLNMFTDFNNISIEINKELSENVGRFLRTKVFNPDE